MHRKNVRSSEWETKTTHVFGNAKHACPSQCQGKVQNINIGSLQRFDSPDFTGTPESFLFISFLFSPCLKKYPKDSACASFGFIPLERINIKNRDHEQLTQNPYFEQLANSPIWLLDCGWGSTKMGSHVFKCIYIYIYIMLTNSENFKISISEMIGIRQQKYPDLWNYPNYGSSSIRSHIGCSQGAKKTRQVLTNAHKKTQQTLK